MAQTGECTRKCKEVGEIEAMDADGSGRSALRTRAMEVTSSECSFKRRRLVTDLVSHHRYDVINSPENSASPAASDRAPVSRCSSDESSEFAKRELRSVDLKVESKAEGCETEISTIIKCRFSRETTSSSELESSTATKPSAASLRRRNMEVKMPPAGEIEEFFSAAEKHEQKRFATKYNYDVKKDMPLEGRYQWVRLKP